MINEVRICEIEDEIRKKEQEQDEAEECSKKCLCISEDIHKMMQTYLSNISHEFEACHGNQNMTYIAEEGYALSLRALRECDHFISDLTAEEIAIKSNCCSDIEELEQEKQVLEVMPI